MRHHGAPTRSGHTHIEHALILVLIAMVGMGGVLSVAYFNPEPWLWENGSAVLWACVSFLLFVALLAAVTFLVFFGLFAIGMKGTIEKDGVKVTPGQIVVGGVIGGIVLVIIIISVVRVVLKFATAA